MKPHFIDANVFLRTVVVEDDQVSHDCKKFLEKVKLNNVRGLTSSVVVAEVVWVLASYYKLTRPSIAEVVEAITSLRGLKIVRTDSIKLAVDIYRDSGVKYVDALIAATDKIQEKKWVVVSYDKDFDKLGVRRVEPGQI